MHTRRYLEVDVFTGKPYYGNPLAVVVDGAGLDTEAMQRFANWTNFSETSFLLPAIDPQADYRVRIFTPSSEMPFAGHPTLGGCHAWLACGGVARDPERIVQECGVGLVRLRRRGARLSFAAPSMRKTPVDPGRRDALCAALRLSPECVREAALLDNGARWLSLLLDSGTTVLALEPDNAALAAFGPVGVVGPSAATAGAGLAACDFEVRAFAPGEGINEDPVTGSLNAALAQWLIGAGLAPSAYAVRQGTRLGRAGRVQIESAGGDVWVGGEVVTCVEGTVAL